MLIAGLHRMCEGATITLSVGAGHDSYLWSPGGQTTASIDVSPTSDETYSVTVTDSGESVVSSSHVVTVFPTPTTTVQYLVSRNNDGSENWLDLPESFTYDNNPVLLRSSEVYALYQWYRNGQPILGATYRTYQAILDGVYSVVMTSWLGCSGESDEHTVEMSDEPSCFVRMLQPYSGDAAVPVNTPIVFDVRFNYLPLPLTTQVPCASSEDTINFCISDGDVPVTTIKPENVAIYDSDSPYGTDNGFRYVITGIRFRSGSPIKLSVVIHGGSIVGTDTDNCP